MAKSPLGSDYDRMRARRNRRMRKIESDHAKLNSNRVSGIRSLSPPAAEATAKLPGISMWWMAVWILVFSPLALFVLLVCLIVLIGMLSWITEPLLSINLLDALFYFYQ